MRTTAVRLTIAAIAAAGFVGTAAAAPAHSTPDLVIAPAAEDSPGTGSSTVDSGSAAAQSVPGLAERGDIIGILVLLGIAPFQMLSSGVCDLATFSGLPDPCSPGPEHQYRGPY